MEIARNFKKLNKNDAPLAGGKGASLGEMTQAGIPVPPGFVVLSASFEQFIKETDLVQEIDAILDKVDHKEIHTVEHASEEIRELILNAEMPKDIADEISRSFKELNTKYVAVRSSATAEDGKDHAWAGQLESYLNTTEDDVLTKVKLCWSSLFTPRAIFYRFEKGLHSTKISVAVVIQKMVESEVSGIAFSVHPVTEDQNQLIIEAGFGLGEAIVSGSVTPDSYVVEKNPRHILDINVSTQERALYRSEKTSVEHGNNEWKDIPEPKASSQVLTEPQILELSEIILNIEKHYGFPCDIEWAFEKGKFYIVQSRPITTLSDNKTTADDGYNWLKNTGKWEKIGTRKATMHRYFDFVECSCFISQKLFKTGLNSSVCFLKNGEVNQYQLESDYNFYIQGFDSFFNDPNNIEYAQDHMVSDSEGFIEWLKDNCTKEKISEISSNNLVALLKERHDLHQKLVAWQWFGFTGKYAIEKAVKERLHIYSLSDSELGKILSIDKAIFILEEDLQLKKLALDKQNGSLSEAELKNKIESHINKYGYFVMYDETYPLMTYQSIVDRLEKETNNKNLNTEIKETIHKFSENKKAFDELITISKFTAEDKNFFRFAHDYAQFMELRNQYRGYSAFLSVPIFSEIAKRLNTTIQKLLCFNDDEISKFLLSGEFQNEEAERRFINSVLIYKEGRYIVEIDADKIKEIENLIVTTDSEVKIIKGNIAFHGKVQGFVRIINSTSQMDKLNEGDVLVSSMTRPDFLTAIHKAVAIVTDEGGITCHAAIVSRELKKPCIIGTKNATKILKDGDLVEVDADHGVVKILPK